MNPWPSKTAAEWCLRLALAAGFVSAVADRLGLWGPPGAPGVAWGAWEPFVATTASLLPWVPAATIPFLAWVATIAEVVIAGGLLAGVRRVEVATASAGLLALFALAMVTSGGLKAPLDYSVFAAAAGSLLLATTAKES